MGRSDHGDSTEVQRASAGSTPRRGGRRSAVEDYAHLVGTMSDRDLAEKIGVDPGTVYSWRKVRGIPAFAAPEHGRSGKRRNPGRPPGRKSPIREHVDVLGTMPDQELAEKIGSSTQLVGSYRRRLGIPVYTGKPSKGLPSPLRALHDVLGTVPDREIARKLGIRTKTVAAYRRRVGIAPFVAPPKEKTVPAPRVPRPSAIDAYAELVGQARDVDVAKLAGVSSSAVQQYRTRRGIPAFVAGPRRSEPGKVRDRALVEVDAVWDARAAPAIAEAGAAVEIQTPTRRSYWVVTVRRGEVQQQYGMVAADIADASVRAVRAVPDGDVISLVRHLEALE